VTKSNVREGSRGEEAQEGRQSRERQANLAAETLKGRITGRSRPVMKVHEGAARRKSDQRREGEHPGGPKAQESYAPRVGLNSRHV